MTNILLFFKQTRNLKISRLFLFELVVNIKNEVTLVKNVKVFFFRQR
jgi:hypothetical protein